MFIILILKNRMFNQSPIFSTSSGPSLFSWNSCSKKHILSRDFYSSKKVKNSWMNVPFISVFRSFQSINFSDWSWEWDFHFSLVFPYLVIIRKNGLLKERNKNVKKSINVIDWNTILATVRLLVSSTLCILARTFFVSDVLTCLAVLVSSRIFENVIVKWMFFSAKTYIQSSSL